MLDVRDGKALLLSRYGLDAKPFNTENESVTGETCSLRMWLNSDFLNAAFNATEQEAILTTDVGNGKNHGHSHWITDGGNDTQDRLFLLSCAEANTYLHVTEKDTENMISRAAPTDFAIRAGAFTADGETTEEGKDAGWWLRSPAYLQRINAAVNFFGALDGRNVYNSKGIVRPALWVDLSSNLF